MIQKELWDKLITYRNLKQKERSLHTLSQLKGSGRTKLVDEQEAIKQTLLKNNDKTIIPKTINIYLTRLNNIFHDTFGQPITSENLNLIADSDKIIKEIHPSKDYQLKDYTRILNDLTALIGVGSRVSENDTMKKALDSYRDLFKELRKQKDEKAGESKQTDDEKKVWIDDLDELRQKVNKINPLDGTSSMNDKAVLALYTMLPPRRLELKDLKVKRDSKAGKGNPIKDNNNYIEVSPQNIVKRIILNNYKTSKTYGQFAFNSKDISRDLINSLKPLLERKKDGEYLFTTRNGTPYDSSMFSHFVKDAFQRRIGMPIRVNDIRHIYASKLWEKNPSMNELKEKSIQMGHSVNTNLENYRRVIDKEDKKED